MINNPFRFYQAPPPAPTYFGGTLPTVNVRASYPDDYVANAVRGGGSKFLGTALGFMGQPQRDIVELFTGVEQTPSEALGISSPVGAFLTDAVLDPLNIGVTSVGGAMMRNSMRNPFRAFNLSNAYKYNPLAGAGQFLTTKTPLKNAYKINPFAFKSNPEAYYHRSPNLENIVNREKRTLQGFGESEAGKAYSELDKPGMGNTLLSDGRISTLNLRKPANSQLYFSKGVPLDYGRYNSPKKGMTGQGYEGPYLVEVEGVPMGSSTKGRKPSLTPPKGKEAYATSHRPISLDEAKFYKEDWLRGYRLIK